MALPTTARAVGLSVVAAFCGTNGAYPWASLLQASDLSFYGTTYSGGAVTNQTYEGWVGYGSVFRVTPDGVLTSLASFYGTNGLHPRAALIQAADGNLYGTTHGGGSYQADGPLAPYESGAGTVFRITLDGTLTTLFSFSVTNGANPATALVKGPDGALYGTTRVGGLGGGTIFRITTNGDFSTVHFLSGGSDGRQPMSPMVCARDGNLYGTASGPGQYGLGLIFKLTVPDSLGSFVTLDQINGVASLGGLVEGRDRNFYGISQVMGAFNHGGTFRISKNGTQAVLASFTDDGGLPWGPLVEGTDGAFYGTRDGGSVDHGSIYKVSRDGVFSTLVRFNLTDGVGPQSGLIQGRDGNLYGTAMGGGPTGFNGFGTVFRVSVPSAAAPLVRVRPSSQNGRTLSWSTIPGRAYQVQYLSSFNETNWNDFGGVVIATNDTCVLADTSSLVIQRLYRVALLP